MNMNSKASCSWRGMASDVSQQALWLCLGRFLCYLPQLNTCSCHPQEHRGLPVTPIAPIARKRTLIFQLSLPTLSPKV